MCSVETQEKWANLDWLAHMFRMFVGLIVTWCELRLCEVT